MGTLQATTYETYESSEKTYVPNDIYTVELTRISEPQVSDPKYKKSPDDPDKHFVFVDFTVIQTVDGDTEFAGSVFDDTAGYTLSKGAKGPSKLRTWVEAFLGRELQPNEAVDFDALVALKPRARATLGTKENGRNAITSMAPIKKKAAAANGTAKPKPADDEETPF